MNSIRAKLGEIAGKIIIPIRNKRMRARFIRDIKGTVRNGRGLEIQIETTSYCNARCSFCPNSTLKRPKQIMDMEVFETILSKLCTEQIPVSSFALHINGEPLSDPHIVERVKLCKQKYPKAIVRFTSNFALANEKLMTDLINAGLDFITISLNTLDKEEYYNTMGLDYDRTYRNVEEFFDLRKRLGSNIRVRISLVTKETSNPDIEAFKKKYKEDAEVRVMKLGAWVDEEPPKDIEISKADIKREGSCGILYHTINFLSNGDYALCCFDAEGVVHKNIKDGEVLDIWGSGIFDRLRKYHLEHGRINKECYNCSYND